MRRVGKFMAKKRCCVKVRCLVVCDCLVVDHDAIPTPAGADDDGGLLSPLPREEALAFLVRHAILGGS